MVDYFAVTEAVATSPNAKTRKTTYNHWSKKDRFIIGKYSAENEHAATVRKFSSKEKPLNESTVRRFCKHYKDELKQSMKEKCDPVGTRPEMNVFCTFKIGPFVLIKKRRLLDVF